MNCEHIHNLLSSFMEDELSAEEKKRVEAHLEECADCRTLLASLKDAREAMMSFPELEVSESLLNRLSAIPHRKRRFQLELDFLLRPSFQPILTAATIIMTLVSFYLFNPNKDEIDKSINRQFHLGYSQVEKLYSRAESFTASLGEYTDNVLVSLKNLNPFRETEE